MWNHEPRSTFNHKKHPFHSLLLFIYLLKLLVVHLSFTYLLQSPLHYHPKTQKHILYHHHHHCYFSLHLYYSSFIFTYCFALQLSLYHSHTLCLTTTWWGWGHKAIYFVCRKSREGQEDKIKSTDSPRVRYKPSSHLRGENKSSTTTNSALGAQPTPYTSTVINGACLGA